MYDHRLTFNIARADLDALQRLATDYRCSVAVIIRDAIGRLLADEAQYRRMLAARLAVKYPPPTPAAVRYIVAGAKFGRAMTTLVESPRVKTP
jgi:hypothetical protein